MSLWLGLKPKIKACFFATSASLQNVVYNVFSELTQNASLLFFRKKINENCNRKILRDNEKLNLNFVENLQRQFSDFSNLETILNRKLCVIFETENRTLRINVVLIFFSS